MGADRVGVGDLAQARIESFERTDAKGRGHDGPIKAEELFSFDDYDKVIGFVISQAADLLARRLNRIIERNGISITNREFVIINRLHQHGSLTQGQLAGLQITGVPADSDADCNLGVTVGVSQNGVALPDLTGSIAVTVDAVADLPTLTLAGTASGAEDTAIALPDISAALQDGDGSETLTLTISGVPVGATLSAGTDQGGGVWSLTGLTQAQLDALSITPPADFSGTFNLTVTATATEGATVAGGGEINEADNTASTSHPRRRRNGMTSPCDPDWNGRPALVRRLGRRKGCAGRDA